jgi:hypothetical protein
MLRSLPRLLPHRAGTILLVIIIAGCGHTATSSNTRTAGNQTYPTQLVVNYGQNGKTVQLRVGQRAVVRLNTLAWRFHPISGSAVAVRGPEQVIRQIRGCKRLEGCGVVELMITALAPGSTVVRATRAICGEQFLCPPQYRAFEVRLAVR